MGNYFSQLAKQSGLRFAGQSGKTRDVKTSPSAPLHQEKTILVASDLPVEKAPKPLQQNVLPNVSKPEKVVGKSSPKEAKTLTAETFTAEESKPLKSTANNQTIETAPEKRIAGFSEIKTVETQFALSERSDSAELPVVEQIVFNETVESAKTNFAESSPMSETIPEVSETKIVEAQTSQKEYFTKTGELLESGDANPQEIQQILFREVQEWVADAPVFTERENIETPVIKISQPPIEPERVLVRESAVHQPDEKQGLEEQNFNLSIGTISIVIEEAEKTSPPENVPPKMSAENRNGETKRQFSRLRRHYL